MRVIEGNWPTITVHLPTGRRVVIEDWPISDCVKLVASRTTEQGGQQVVASLFLDPKTAGARGLRLPESTRMAVAVMKGECPFEVFADWVEDHPEYWSESSPSWDAAVTISNWLRN